MKIHKYSGGCNQARAGNVAASGSASGKQHIYFLLKICIQKYLYFLQFTAMLIGESSAGPSNTRQSGEGKN